jgi:Tol biopolymer transport system component/DNA-binding winged helix-turn-helix (wHTH) protein
VAVEKSIHNAQVVGFATFEVDLETGELRKSGLKLKLSGQPFQVLAVLLERPGRIVTREELQKRLWPDTFVDVEHNLNTAINKIRETLGDSAENPRFVETLPRRGYRFIAPLDGAAATAGSLAPVDGADSALAGREGTASTGFPHRERPQRRRSELLYAVVAGAVLASVGLYAWTVHSRLPRVTRSTQITSDSQAKTASYASELLSPLVSDGSRLHFMEGPLGSEKLAQVSTGGGETTLLPAPFRIRRVVDVSPDQHELLVLSSDQYLRTETPLMILPLPAGSPRRVGDVLAHDASWSPDGSKIVYANGHDLYLTQKDGKQALKLATVPGIAWWPRWSPDGSVLRFTVSDALNLYKLWEVSIDGSRLHRLLPDLVEPLSQCCGSWTPDGRYFVFASSFESSSQLWAFRERGGFQKKAHDLTQLTTGPMSMFAPLLGADGNRLFAIAAQQRGQLVRYDTKLSQFVPFLSGVSVENVDFSKDGQWVTYVAYPEGTLWRSRADGTERLQLTLPPMQVGISRWSPDGKRIGFLAQATTGKPFKIYFVSADGGIPQQAIPDERNDGEPSWSPDGNSVVFASLFWMEKDRQKGLQLLDLRTGQVTPVSGSEGLFSARWSPDGRHIAALTTDPSQTLVLFDLKTQERKELRKTVAYPNWSRDGRYIYFDDPYGDEAALYRVRISDGEVEKVTTLDPRVLNWAIVGKWTGLSPDDSPLVLRDTSVEEIYTLDVQLP